MLNRRQVLAGATAFAGTQLATPALAQNAPIRIGMLSVKSGALATGGRQMEDGFQLFLKERGNSIAGRPDGTNRRTLGQKEILAEEKSSTLL